MLLPWSQGGAHISLTGASDHTADHAPAEPEQRILAPTGTAPYAKGEMWFTEEAFRRGVAQKLCRFPPALAIHIQQESDNPGVRPAVQPASVSPSRRALPARPPAPKQPASWRCSRACTANTNPQVYANSKNDGVVEAMAGSRHYMCAHQQKPASSKVPPGLRKSPPPPNMTRASAHLVDRAA